jgi:hypothetical protein
MPKVVAQATNIGECIGKAHHWQLTWRKLCPVIGRRAEEVTTKVASVFLSYTHTDADLVEGLERELRQLRIAAWRDQQNLYSGVYQAGGDILINMPAATAARKPWPERWQVWVAIVVGILSATTLAKGLMTNSTAKTPPVIHTQPIQAT